MVGVRRFFLGVWKTPPSPSAQTCVATLSRSIFGRNKSFIYHFYVIYTSCHMSTLFIHQLYMIYTSSIHQFIHHFYVTYTSFIQHLYVTYTSVYIICTLFVNYLYVIYTSMIHHLYIAYTSFIHHFRVIYKSFKHNFCIIYASFIHHSCIIYTSFIHHLFNFNRLGYNENISVVYLQHVPNISRILNSADQWLQHFLIFRTFRTLSEN